MSRVSLLACRSDGICLSSSLQTGVRMSSAVEAITGLLKRPVYTKLRVPGSSIRIRRIIVRNSNGSLEYR